MGKSCGFSNKSISLIKVPILRPMSVYTDINSSKANLQEFEVFKSAIFLNKTFNRMLFKKDSHIKVLKMQMYIFVTFYLKVWTWALWLWDHYSVEFQKNSGWSNYCNVTPHLNIIWNHEIQSRIFSCSPHSKIFDWSDTVSKSAPIKMERTVNVETDTILIGNFELQDSKMSQSLITRLIYLGEVFFRRAVLWK